MTDTPQAPICTDDHANGIDCPAHPGAAELTGPLVGQDRLAWALRNPTIATPGLLAEARDRIGWDGEDDEADPTGEWHARALRDTDEGSLS